MKINKILILGLIFINITGQVNAASSCLISSGPSNGLEKYIENNNIVISNVTNQILKSQNEQDKSLKENFIALFNNVINWTGYESYFRYFVSFPLGNDISKEVKRDYRLLEKQGNGLNLFLKTVANKGYNIQINDACKSINSNYCKLEGDAINIVGELIKNQSYIIDIYRRAVMGDLNPQDYTGKLILVDNTDNKFINDIINNYGLGNNCADAEDSFFAKIWEKIKSIGDYNKNYKKGVEEWKEAIAMLNGDKPTDELEEQLLVQELSRQGISGDKAQAIVSNLKKYNANGGYSLDNNFIANTFRELSNTIEKEKEKFKTNVIDEFTKNLDEKNTKSITSLLSDSQKVKVNLQISEAVSQIYNSQLPFIEIGDKNTISTRADIINMHNNINNGIKKLEDLIEVSEKVCNDQSTGEGKCTTN